MESVHGEDSFLCLDLNCLSHLDLVLTQSQLVQVLNYRFASWIIVLLPPDENLAGRLPLK